MKIEPMTADDLREVSALADQLGYRNSFDDVSTRFHQMLNDSRYGLFVAKDDEHKVIGWIQINVEPTTLLIGPCADIAALIVDQEHRSKGIGRELICAAETWARSRNLPVVRVRSNAKRSDAHRFYLREGYTLAKTSNIFVKYIQDLEGSSSLVRL